MKQIYLRGEVSKRSMFRGLLNALWETLKVMVVIAIFVTLFLYLTNRAMDISQKNYCSLYPSALSCKINK